MGRDRKGNTMTMDEALARLSHALATCSDDGAAAARTILRRGAGVIGLPPDAVLTAPAGLVPERREAWATLADALRIDAVGVSGDWRADAAFAPVRAGEWEAVLVTLLVERDWDAIERTANDLREAWPE